jgi:hypothetical protein
LIAVLAWIRGRAAMGAFAAVADSSLSPAK